MCHSSTAKSLVRRAPAIIVTGLSSGLAAGLAASSLALVPASGAWATTPCGTVTNAYVIANGVCQIDFTTPGNVTWTPPAGTTKLDALLIGGGGAGYHEKRSSGGGFDYIAYGGGGGDVQLLSLSATGDVSLTVGSGGVSGGADGGDTVVTQGATSLTATGGETTGGSAVMSGSGNAGDMGFCTDGTSGISGLFGGGGGAGAASVSSNGGTGSTVANLPGASTSLFAGDTDCLGGGGGSAVHDPQWPAAFWSDPVCGGGALTMTVNGGQAYLSHSVTTPIANSGGGGAGYYFEHGVGPTIVQGSQNGADGAVHLRFDSVAAVLPDTGVSNAGSWIAYLTALSFLSVGFGGVMLAARLHRRARA